MQHISQTTTVLKGTAASYTSTAAGFPVGTTKVPLITGTGTVLAGNSVTFAGDANVYFVKTGVTAPGSLELYPPGLLVALPATAQALTIGNDQLALLMDNLVAEELSLEVANSAAAALTKFSIQYRFDQLGTWWSVADVDLTTPKGFVFASSGATFATLAVSTKAWFTLKGIGTAQALRIIIGSAGAAAVTLLGKSRSSYLLY